MKKALVRITVAVLLLFSSLQTFAQDDEYSTVYLSCYHTIMTSLKYIIEINDNYFIYLDEGHSYITIKCNCDKISFRVWWTQDGVSYESLKAKDNNETRENKKRPVFEYMVTPNTSTYLCIMSTSIMGDKKENFEKNKNKNKISLQKEIIVDGIISQHENQPVITQNAVQQQVQSQQPVIQQPVVQQTVQQTPVVTSNDFLSDVDTNIPQTKKNVENTYVLIIANEDYQFIDKVKYAARDGEVFNEYCIKTLGVPEKQVWFYKDASAGIISGGVGKMVQAMSLFENSKAIVYYCGHGIPDEHTGDAYIVPTDGNGKNLATCYSLNKLYTTLAASNAASVTYFMDACFSGANKEGSMLVAARGVAREAKKETLKGNTVVFSAASGDETAMTYKEKGHGLFTYYLLKKLQETKGDVSYGDLDKYIKDNVKRESFLTNEKVQTPTTNVSENAVNSWRNMRLK